MQFLLSDSLWEYKMQFGERINKIKYPMKMLQWVTLSPSLAGGI